ncbi:unnamed protein product [Gongylonema pulchrum]|uniref:UvrD_C_2 domain-containing protein n=1 Tax=Gongylonema pulchrum TaxID=637853 RepID=A0A183E0L2_9BILA|nr:unnamed protein product [Gongylonema pulchrum]
MGLPRILQLKVGARYTVTYNLDTSDGLINGATERLVHIDMAQQRPETNAPRKPPTVGTNLRRRYGTIIAASQYPPNWTPLEPATVTIKCNKLCNLQVLRKQFPIVPAEAITIHKSQGQTSLFIIGSFVPPNEPHPNDPLQLELQRQERCLPVPAFKFLHETRTVVQDPPEKLEERAASYRTN